MVYIPDHTFKTLVDKHVGYAGGKIAYGKQYDMFYITLRMLGIIGDSISYVDYLNTTSNYKRIKFIEKSSILEPSLEYELETYFDKLPLGTSYSLIHKIHTYSNLPDNKIFHIWPCEQTKLNKLNIINKHDFEIKVVDGIPHDSLRRYAKEYMFIYHHWLKRYNYFNDFELFLYSLLMKYKHLFNVEGIKKDLHHEKEFEYKVSKFLYMLSYNEYELLINYSKYYKEVDNTLFNGLVTELDFKYKKLFKAVYIHIRTCDINRYDMENYIEEYEKEQQIKKDKKKLSDMKASIKKLESYDIENLIRRIDYLEEEIQYMRSHVE